MGVTAAVQFDRHPLLVVADEYVGFAGWLPSLPTLVSNGVVPLALVLAGAADFYDSLKNGLPRLTVKPSRPLSSYC
jgi:hypothetical protein